MGQKGRRAGLLSCIYRLSVGWGWLTLREECRLWVFESRVLRGKFGSRSDEVTGEWRKLQNEELNNLYW
jgi:hypothetical protein